MRQIAVSVFTIFVVLPAWASARLPVVNIAAGGVSARSAFGDTITNVTPAAPVSAVATPSIEKKVIARASSKKNATPRAAADITAGAQIAKNVDVLSPRRPSGDLWARATDAPLRMPDASEFAVFRNDSALPEESLDVSPRGNVVAHASTQSDVMPLSEFDAQIARLNELQKRADNSVNSRDFAATKPADITVRSMRPVVDAAAVTVPAPVKLSRMVVPMADDVVVRAVEKSESPRIIAVRDDMTKMSPTELRRAFRKTFLSENKHLSTYQIDDRFDVASDMTASSEGFTARRDLSEVGGIRPLEIKIKFRDEDSALSRDNYNLLSEYAGIVLANPTRAVQVGIPQNVANNADARKLAARRLAIVEQVLRDSGVSEQRIMPVLSQRNDEGFVLRMISNDQYETLTQKRRDIFGDTVSKKTYKSMSW